MFNFSTTTFINGVNYLDTTTPRFAAKAGEALVIKYNDLRIKTANAVKDSSNKVIVYKKVGCVGTVDSATVNIPSAAEGDRFRLRIYVGLSMADQSSYYANDLVFKGRPFTVEFTSSGIPATDAEALVKNINKYELVTVEKPVLDVTSSGAVVTIKGTSPYQRIKKVVLEKYNTAAVDVIPGASGGFEETVVGTITNGHEEFGTYYQLTKDNHLPTYENRGWAVNQIDETPIPGNLYNQYVIRECVDRGVMGGDAVGESTKSLTTHVFWVSNAIASGTETVAAKFEAAIEEAFGKSATSIVIVDDHTTNKVSDTITTGKSARNSGTAHTDEATEKTSPEESSE